MNEKPVKEWFGPGLVRRAMAGLALLILAVQLSCAARNPPVAIVHFVKETTIRVGESVLPHQESAISVTLASISGDRAFFRVTNLTTGEVKEGWLRTGQNFATFARPEMGPMAATLLRVDQQEGSAVVQFGRPEYRY